MENLKLNTTTVVAGCQKMLVKVERAGSVCSEDAPSSPESVISVDSSPLSSPQPSPAPALTDPYDDHRIYSPAYTGPMSPSSASASPTYSYSSSPVYQSSAASDDFSFQFPPPSGYESSDDAYCYQSEFSRAVREGNPKELKRILSRYPQLVQINGFTGDGQTALTQSCKNGNLEMFKLLVAHGASLSLTNRDGFSPLHVATFHGRVDILQYILNLNSNNRR